MTDEAARNKVIYWLAAVIPQVLTGSRIFFGAAAIVRVSRGDHYWAAALITLGAVTDVLDGLAARRLGTSSAFGALFDTFTDYLCFVVAPWALTRGLVGADGNIWIEIMVGLPLLTAAIRYARNSLIIATHREEIMELPGLATVFYAFLPVAVVFLDARSLVSQTLLLVTLTCLVVLFSMLMVTSVRYPKLSSARILTAPVTILLIAMPFVGTRFLALIMLVAGLIYVAVAPFLIRADSGGNRT